ncbi:MAG: SDR family oxidoreductase [Polyangiaceae bacterium]|nr:SDR family oxidoreductase [Polyangiaceae bacterium]MCE7893840.1 SDR family oxidoreductase [Sorangiineae bacterium PRO1]MCL4748931.1 SDR family oxidoreductase [Myxococcales bacterium]
MRVFAEDLLAGQVALITGGGSGIGAGVARRLAEQGAKVALVGRKLDKLESSAARIRDAGGTARCFAADVRDYAALEAAVRSVVAEWGRLDVLINSAAGNFLAPAAGLSANGFKSVIEIDLVGTFNASRACFEPLAVRGGSIVSITATQAWVPTPLQCHAGAAKAGIAKLTQDLALEWGGSKIRVNAVAPGPIADTEGMRRLAPADSEAQKRLEGSMPIGRWGSVAEVADAVLFLVSPAAGFITGTTLVVDGGQSLLGAGNLFSLGG